MRLKGDSNPDAGTACIPPVRRLMGLWLREGATGVRSCGWSSIENGPQAFCARAVLPTIGVSRLSGAKDSDQERTDLSSRVVVVARVHDGALHPISRATRYTRGRNGFPAALQRISCSASSRVGCSAYCFVRQVARQTDVYSGTCSAKGTTQYLVRPHSTSKEPGPIRHQSRQICPLTKRVTEEPESRKMRSTPGTMDIAKQLLNAAPRFTIDGTSLSGGYRR